ncbi:hypothetical protein CHISP_1876 [Chitinispirillum alkaliphilum]|nr:hypothetical protein CHISP_1876 [Chitinispirillum alkaliphilum]
MKKTTFAVLVPMLIACVEFSTRYELIESNEVRLLDFMYEPVDASPGDTVQLTAVFGGKEIGEHDIDWSVSWDLVTNRYGIDSAFGVAPLDNRIPQSVEFSENTSTISFSFVIPDDVIRNSNGVLADLSSMLPPHKISSLPPEIQNVSKHEMIGFVEELAYLAQENPQGYSQIVTPEIEEFLPGLLQLLTARIRIFAKIRGGHTIRSDFSVRYNSRFESIPAIPLNRNPVIDSAGIYKVKGDNIFSYDPSEGRHQFIRLASPQEEGNHEVNEIVVENGYSYFIAAFSSNYDSTITMEGYQSGNSWIKEAHRTRWKYNLAEDQTSDVATNRLMNIAVTGNKISQFFPPSDRRVENAIIWLELYDYVMGEIFRPDGSDLREYHVRFVYD